MRAKTPARVEVRDGIGYITLTRPERLNALSLELLLTLRRSLIETGERRDVRAVLLEGEGRAFCAGLDLDEGIGDPTCDDSLEGAASWRRISADVTWAMRCMPSRWSR